MARRKKVDSEYKVRELDLEQARREFNRKKSRGSKYDTILSAADKLEPGRALLVENLTYPDVNGIRMRLRDYLGDGWTVEATKVDKEKDLYDVLISREVS